jgi:hypothetical protein
MSYIKEIINYIRRFVHESWMQVMHKSKHSYVLVLLMQISPFFLIYLQRLQMNLLLRSLQMRRKGAPMTEVSISYFPSSHVL